MMKLSKSLPQLPSSFQRPLIGLAIVAAVLAGWWLINRAGDTDSAGSSPAPAAPNSLQLNIRDGDTFTDPVLAITGVAMPNQQVTVNGQSVPVSAAGDFELTLRLAEGPNLIIVEARDGSGAVLSIARRVTYVLPGEEAPPPESPGPAPSTGLLVLAFGLILTAVLVALIRRRRPWVHLTTDAPGLRPGPKGQGPVVAIIVELDRASRLSLYLLDGDGAPVSTLLNNRRRKAGRHTYTFDGYVAGSVLPAGAYSIVTQAGVPLFKTSAEATLQIETAPS